MAVRNHIPDSLSFTVEVQLSPLRRLRVPIAVDLQDRYVSLSASIVYEVLPELEDFLDQLSDITSNQLAFLKWDGSPDPTTEFQWIRILPGMRVERAIARFSFVLENSTLLTVQELTANAIIHVLDG